MDPRDIHRDDPGVQEPDSVPAVHGSFDQRGSVRSRSPRYTRAGRWLSAFVAPGNVPVFFDHEGVSQVIGDLSGRGAETS